MTSEPTAPSDGHGDILAELTAVLAGVVDADPDRVDPEQPFAVLGLDSLLTVEFVSAIARHFGVRIVGADLYEYPTPALLARHLAAVRGGADDAPAVRGPGASAEVLQVLRRQLARILHCDPWEIDGGAAFAELGIDSLLAAEFIAGVNRAYGLNERPVTVREHPTLAAMAAYVASRTAGAVPPANPDTGSGDPAAPEATPTPSVAAAAKRPPLSQDELVALLDAVRGDRIGVEEAAALLADPGSA
ncbi:acyl carrier protein [Streptomyces sp. NPDC007206]|uniref:acyl carrier protein n=1 Tax=Streptomyces sp. NPDC007206 TaxID=3154317 RepID=UPI0033D43CD1